MLANMIIAYMTSVHLLVKEQSDYKLVTKLCAKGKIRARGPIFYKSTKKELDDLQCQEVFKFDDKANYCG